MLSVQVRLFPKMENTKQIQIVLKSHHFDFLNNNIAILHQMFADSDIIRLPVKIKKWTVIRSPHVHKKSREQFEMRTYTVIFKIKQADFEISHLQNLICTGVQMQIRYVSETSL